MKELAVVIGLSINWIIGVLFFLTVGGFIIVVVQVRKIDKERKEMEKRPEERKFGGGRVQIAKDTVTITWDKIKKIFDDFNKAELVYSVFEQVVPVFPLLGILGTVAGLIQQLDDVDKMKDALTTSMSTTFWGLIAAIVLKIIDAVLVSRAVNKMGLYFETFERYYQFEKDAESNHSNEADYHEQGCEDELMTNSDVSNKDSGDKQ